MSNLRFQVLDFMVSLLIAGVVHTRLVQIWNVSKLYLDFARFPDKIFLVFLKEQLHVFPSTVKNLRRIELFLCGHLFYFVVLMCCFLFMKL